MLVWRKMGGIAKVQTFVPMRIYSLWGREFFILPLQTVGGGQVMVVASLIEDGISDITKIFMIGNIIYGSRNKK
jgi:hypothetical protein